MFLDRKISLQSASVLYASQLGLCLVALRGAQMFAEMMPDGKTFYFITVGTIKQLLEVLLL